MCYDVLLDSMKRHISLTVEASLLDWVDEMTRRQLFRNRSHAFERALQVYKESVETYEREKKV